ncbi:MAG: glycosyltransferase [Acidobacteria bacterium]|nr:glycosyltransferase [Acidobacteriota bacterium]
MDPIRLSVILPAYNEAAGIASSLERLGRHLSARGGAWEIVVVDDGSADDTRARVTEASRSDPRVRLVALEAHQGKGGAVIRGLAEARGAIIATTDADLSYALEDLDAVIAAVEGGADVATGNRHDPASRIELRSGLLPYLVRRWIAGSAFRLVVHLLFRLGVTDTQCGLKAFSRRGAEEVRRRLVTRRFLFDVEIFVIASGLGLRVAEVPVRLRYLSGGSSVRMVSGLPATAMDLARIKIADVRGRYG